jgi:protein-S-isoprenylcysteine O-methyltransferase Ste14
MFIGLGSIALFTSIPLGSLSAVRLPQKKWPVPGLLGWDAALSLSFFFQHSGMVRRGFRDRYLARIVAPPYQPAVYSIASGIALTAVVLLWQPVADPRLLVVDATVGHPLLYALTIAGKIFAFAIYIWGVLALGGRCFDPLGLSPIQDFLKGMIESAPSGFVVRGPYRWVRHPLYISIILLIWLEQKVTPDRLLFNVLWTGWIWIATRLEEKDLRREFGPAYDRYQQSVPMLVPSSWRGSGAGAKARFSDRRD